MIRRHHKKGQRRYDVRCLLLLLMSSLFMLVLLNKAFTSSKKNIQTVVTRSIRDGTSTQQRRLPLQGRTDYFFGIKSGASAIEAERRQQWRNSHCAKHYKSMGAGFKFMVGRPYEPNHDLTLHNQGGQDTETEKLVAEKLFNEAREYQDMVILPMRDAYMSLPDKVVLAYEYMLNNLPDDVPYLGMHDVEYCFNLKIVNEIVQSFEQESPRIHDFLWAGNYLWKGDEYDSMKGAENIARPYISGWANFLSRGLINLIIKEDRDHTVLNGMYGSVSEDVDVGKWVAFAESQHNVRTSLIGRNDVIYKLPTSSD